MKTPLLKFTLLSISIYAYILQIAIGQNWTACSILPNGSGFEVASSSDGNVLIASSFYNTYISTNSGLNWNSALSGGGRTACSADGQTIMVSVPLGGGVHVSTNSGNTWAQVGVSGPYSAWNVAISGNGRVMAVIGGDTGDVGGNFFVSTNYGGSWFNCSVDPGLAVCAISTNGDKLVALASTDGIYTSTNFGSTWIRTSAPITNYWWVAVACSADGNKIIAISQPYEPDQFYSSTNAGLTWNPIKTPLVGPYMGHFYNVVWSQVACSSDGSHIAATCSIAGDYNFSGVYASSDFGASWQLSFGKNGGAFNSIASSADGSKLIAGDNILAYTWSALPLLSAKNGLLSWQALSSAAGYVCQQNSDLFSTNWVNVTNQKSLFNGTNQIFISPPSGNMFYRLMHP